MMKCNTYIDLPVFCYLYTCFYAFFYFNAAFDRLNVPIYEEVAKMPPFERKTLLLIGICLLVNIN